MATNFPTNLDDSSTIPAESASTKLSVNHVVAHQNIQDAIEAVEAKVGVDGSAVTTSHDYKLSGVTGSDKAVSKTGTETLTNKTLTSPTITSPALTVGSDATGDLYYRSAGGFTRLGAGSNGQILKLAAGIPSWATETVTNDASTTVKGIVEAATSAEVTAGTGTGGTGAVLAVTPDALAASTPVFNGSGLTGMPIKHLKSGSGSSTAGSATTVDSIAITGLTANDTIMVRLTIQSPGGTTTNPLLYSVTDSQTLLDILATTTTANETYVMECVIRQSQDSATTLLSASNGRRSATIIGGGQSSAVTTSWTSSWTLGLRHGGVSSGTFRWSWSVYKLAGQ